MTDTLSEEHEAADDQNVGKGDASRVALRVASLRFSGGQEVTLLPDTVLVIVGPNNAGKSRALREIALSLAHAGRGRVVADVDFATSGSLDDLKAWISNQFVETEHGSFQGIAGTLGRSDLKRWPWRPLDKVLARHLCLLATAEDRFKLLNNPPLINPLRDAETHPLHHLLIDDRFEIFLSEIVRRAFNVDVILNRGAGEKLRFHCGIRPDHVDRVGLDYLRALDAMPTLDVQGDGLRSFYGCLVQAILGPWKVTLLDEPEVFLHPPQAEQLGEVLVRNTPPGRQLIISTHSSELLRGMLKHNAARIKLVRIVRNGSVNIATELGPEQVSSIWHDPSLRFSRALDGIFHEAVVVCESDADCRFYEAIMEAKYPNVVRPMFVPAGGKQALKKLVASLGRLNVPCSAVADFDVLNDAGVLKGLWEAAGGTWQELEKDWLIVRDGVEANSVVPHRGRVLEEIRELLKGPPAQRLSDTEAERIRTIAKGASGWSKAKSAGLAALPQGDVATAGARLLKTLATRNVHVVPVGELERFVPTSSGKSGAWVSDVLGSRDLLDSSLSQAHEFVASICPPSRSLRAASSAPTIPLGRRVKRRMTKVFERDKNDFTPRQFFAAGVYGLAFLAMIIIIGQLLVKIRF